LQQRVDRRPRLRLWRRRPMAEGEEADVFHGGYMGMIVQFHSSNLKNYAARFAIPGYGSITCTSELWWTNGLVCDRTNP
jgi:hypothetical protein